VFILIGLLFFEFYVNEFLFEDDAFLMKKN